MVVRHVFLSASSEYAQKIYEQLEEKFSVKDFDVLCKYAATLEDEPRAALSAISTRRQRKNDGIGIAGTSSL